ncbi:hypothetical protein J2S02_004823 [Metabacillus niabensis]|uniref:Uncharacterized protein n=1 Tax=Metabacillus niabensis TaxID=324854 RepID=A0ABT9ZAY9_9BACI|nr:hypothetical protein [Metabacillus niabensis]
MKLLQSVLLERIKREPLKVRAELINDSTMDYKLKSQIIALTYVYEKEENHEKFTSRSS